MIDSLRRQRDWSGLFGATIVAVLLLCSLCVPPLSAQGIWRNNSVVWELWLGERVLVDSAAMPAVVITRSGLTYIAFSLRGGEWRYYTKDLPSLDGSFSGFSPIYYPPGTETYNAGPANLLAVDSASSLHYITSRAGNDSCLQYAKNVLNDTILTSFSYLEKVRPELCGKVLGGASTAVDRIGRLHVVCIVDNTLFYFLRDAKGWSQGIRISDTSLLCSSPSLAVGGLGDVHATFLSRRSPQENEAVINYVHGFDAVFDAPVSLAVRKGEGSDRVVPITLDPRGFCHVAFVDQFSGGSHAIRYTNNIGGTWQMPANVVEDTRYSIGDLSLAGDRYGAMHIVAHYRLDAPDSLPDAELLYATNAAGAWSAPVNITANDVDDNALNQGNGFIALRDSALAVAYTTSGTEGRTGIALARTVLDFNPVLVVKADTINLGVRIAKAGPGGGGLEIDTAITLHNGGPKLYNPLLLESLKITNPVSGPVSLKPVGTLGEIRGGESVDLPVTLSVAQPGIFSARLVISSNGGTDTVVVMGTLRDPQQPMAILQLDTNHAYVGNPVPLTCRAIPALEAFYGITSISASLLFDPRALFPERVFGPEGIPIPFTYDSKGTLTLVVNGKDGGGLQGETLFVVEFKGLVTGNPINPVELRVEPIPGLFDPTVKSGLIYLEGCNVGIPGVSKAGFAGRISPNPVQDRLSFQYLAPPEVRVSVRLVDLLGTSHLEHDLPSGTGDVQDASLDLRSLASGLYLVRLRVGERVVTDMMIKE